MSCENILCGVYQVHCTLYLGASQRSWKYQITLPRKANIQHMSTHLEISAGIVLRCNCCVTLELCWGLSEEENCPAGDSCHTPVIIFHLFHFELMPYQPSIGPLETSVGGWDTRFSATALMPVYTEGRRPPTLLGPTCPKSLKVMVTTLKLHNW